MLVNGFTLSDLEATHALYPGWRMDFDYSRYCGWKVEKIDFSYWLLNPVPGVPVKLQGPYETERQAWLNCPKFSRVGPLVIENIERLVLPKERELKFHGAAHVYYDEHGILHRDIRVRWRFQTVWYRGEGIDYAHAALRSHLAYFIRKAKRTGPLADSVETAI